MLLNILPSARARPIWDTHLFLVLVADFWLKIIPVIKNTIVVFIIFAVSGNGTTASLCVGSSEALYLLFRHLIPFLDVVAKVEIHSVTPRVPCDQVLGIEGRHLNGTDLTVCCELHVVDLFITFEYLQDINFTTYEQVLVIRDLTIGVIYWWRFDAVSKLPFNNDA